MSAVAGLGRSTLLAMACAQALARPREWAGELSKEAVRQAGDTLPLALLLSSLGGLLISQQTGCPRG